MRAYDTSGDWFLSRQKKNAEATTTTQIYLIEQFGRRASHDDTHAAPEKLDLGC